MENLFVIEKIYIFSDQKNIIFQKLYITKNSIDTLPLKIHNIKKKFPAFYRFSNTNKSLF